MVTATSHFAREQTVLNDLEGSFPDFTRKGLSWVHLQNPDDPPDFLAQGPGGAYGLEFREWLDGDQMTEAQRRDKQRRRLIDDVLGTGWDRFQTLCQIIPRTLVRLRFGNASHGTRGTLTPSASSTTDNSPAPSNRNRSSELP